MREMFQRFRQSTLVRGSQLFSGSCLSFLHGHKLEVRIWLYKLPAQACFRLALCFVLPKNCTPKVFHTRQNQFFSGKNQF